MDVDFAGKTFSLINRLTGDVTPIIFGSRPTDCACAQMLSR